MVTVISISFTRAKELQQPVNLTLFFLWDRRNHCPIAQNDLCQGCLGKSDDRPFDGSLFLSRFVYAALGKSTRKMTIHTNMGRADLFDSPDLSALNHSEVC